MCIKVGDRFVRTSLGIGLGLAGVVGYEGTVCRVYADRITDASGVVHVLENIKRIEPDLQTRISKLESELNKLKEEATNQSLDEAKLLRHKVRGSLHDIIGRHGDFLWIAPQDGSNPISFHRKDMDRFEIMESNCGC